MPETPSQWLNKAEGNLRRAKAAYEEAEYWDAVSHLQQADEKIAKALLMVIGIIPNSDGAALLSGFLGIEHTSPKKLGHNWHESLIEDFRPFLASFERITKSLDQGKSEPMKSAAGWWKEKIPQYQTAAKKSRSIKSKPVPSLDELDAAIRDSNKALDLAKSLPESLKLPEVMVPNYQDVSASLDKSLRAFKARVDKKTRKMQEEEAIARIPLITSIFNEAFLESVQRSYLLVSLMVLNVYLQEHHSLANYPTDRVVYDKKMPIIVRFGELHALLQRCLTMTKSLGDIP